MSSIDLRFHAKLKELVDRELAGITDQLLAGIPQSFDEYQKCVGKALAFRAVLEMAKRVETDVTGGK